MRFVSTRGSAPAVGFSEAIVNGIQHFAAAHGATRLYNDTLTRFWARLIKHHIDLADAPAPFDAFIARYPRLLETGLTYLHYSRELLTCEPARTGWVDPDIRPLPAVH